MIRAFIVHQECGSGANGTEILSKGSMKASCTSENNERTRPHIILEMIIFAQRPGVEKILIYTAYSQCRPSSSSLRCGIASA